MPNFAAEGVRLVSYVALYREWRPQSFCDVVGQEHVTRTLQNALVQGRLTHAYLFSGPRGTGKTTVAKLLAKAVNCLHGPRPEPCNECAVCERITAGHSVDVLEIDAASNRGIDEIRDLREKVQYTPSESNYKVYIIDEVHMLTPEAFNALLKTLEEPPSHAIFVLATTEPHKIPATIVSRCQRFVFHKLANEVIVNRLAAVCESKGVSAEPAALTLLTRHAEGSLRDGLSMLDQCLSFSGDALRLQDVHQVLGDVDAQALFDLSDAIAEDDAGMILRLIAQQVELGKDPRRLAYDLTSHFRNLLVVAHCPDDSQVGSDLILLYGLELAKQARRFEGRLYEIIKALSALTNDLRGADQPRLVLEVGLLALAKEHGYATEAERVTEPEMAAPPKSTDNGLSLAAVKERWAEVLEQAKRLSPSLRALLVEAQPVGLNDNGLYLSVPYAFHRERLAENKNIQGAQEALRRVFGQSLTICVLESEQAADRDSDQETGDSALQEALRVFGGHIVESND